MGEAEIRELQRRLDRGEEYLAGHPDDVESKALYFRLMDEYTRLATAEESRLVVTLALPEWVSTPDGGHTVRVCLDGQRHDGELDRDDMAILNMAMAEGQRA